MTDDHGVLLLHVSPALLRLVTECILVRSNENRRLETVDRLMKDLLAAIPSAAEAGIDDLRDHLTAMPSPGPIAVHFRLTTSERLVLDAYRTALADALGEPASLADAFSAILFGYLVDHKVQAATAAIAGGAAPDDATRHAADLSLSAQVTRLRR